MLQRRWLRRGLGVRLHLGRRWRLKMRLGGLLNLRWRLIMRLHRRLRRRLVARLGRHLRLRLKMRLCLLRR